MRAVAVLALSLAMYACAHRIPEHQMPTLAIPGKCIEELRIQPNTLCNEQPDGWYDCNSVRVKVLCVEVVKK